MSANLHDRLAELASGAPSQLPGGDLWQQGRRHHRVRRVKGVAALAMVLLVIGGAAQLETDGRKEPRPAGVPEDGGNLPEKVYEPGEWSAGTSEDGEIGPLAVVGLAMRARPVGWSGERRYQALFGVSAVDGTVRFLDIPTNDDDGLPGQGGQVALSDDGTKVGYVRYDEVPEGDGGRAIGWGVYDTVTGEVLELEDSRAPRPVAQNAFEIELTGDSRYLATVYSRTAPENNRNDELVIWDVETGERIPVEGPGRYWLPNMGSAPDGVVWSRGSETFTFDPATRVTTSVSTAHDVVTASHAPTGDAFAYVGSTLTRQGMSTPWRLYAGPSPDQLRLVRLQAEPPGVILGWQDATHVVVGDHRATYAVVDVTTGQVEYGNVVGVTNVYSSEFAGDLWANELVPGVEPPQPSDPRTGRMLWIGGSLAALLGLGLGLVRRRRRG